MEFNEFQKKSLRTWKSDQTQTEQLANAAMGLAGEAGEVCDYIKKVLFQGHELNTRKVVEEVGDVLFYAAAILSAMGEELDEAAQANIAKLLNRYPEGFDANRSVNRMDK